MTSTPIPTTTPTTTPTRGPPPALLSVPVPAVPCAPAAAVVVVVVVVAGRTHNDVARCAALKQLPSLPRTTLKLTTDSSPPASVSVSASAVPPHAFAVQSTDVSASAVLVSRGTELCVCATRRV